jgi:hypothetical protein
MITNNRGYFYSKVIGNYTDIKVAIKDVLEYLCYEENISVCDIVIDTWDDLIDFITKNHDGNHNKLWKIQLYRNDYEIKDGNLVI